MSATAAMPVAEPKIHRAWVRICHWINALAILAMIGSGWQIYNASPLLNFIFPQMSVVPVTDQEPAQAAAPLAVAKPCSSL